VEPDLKELLHRKADDMHLPPDLPPVTLRRARRRRGWSAAFASMTAVLFVAGTITGVQLMTRSSGTTIGQSPAPTGTPDEPTTPEPAPADSEFAVPAVWPETNRADIESEQQRVNTGADRWRTDPLATASHFANDVAGWNDVAVDIASLDPIVGSAVVDVVKRNQVDTEGFGALTLDMARVARSGAGGIWSVVTVAPYSPNGQHIDLSCGTDPLVPGRPATLCGALPPALANHASVRYAIFDGDRFDLASFGDAPVHGTMLVEHDRFHTSIIGQVDANASVLALEVLHSSGVVTAMVQRLRRSGASQAPAPR
jgi:hypothetical protein